MIALPRQNSLFPADPVGQRLCEIFGRYRWKCIRAELPDDATAKPPGRPSLNTRCAPACCGTTGKMPTP
jgi:hypothetical protein